MSESKELTEAIKGLYTTNLGVKKDERILVFTDIPSPDEDIAERERVRRERLPGLARMVADVGKELCQMDFLTYPSLKGHGVEPPREVWLAAFGLRVVEEMDQRGLLERVLAKDTDLSYTKEVDEIVKRHKGEAVNAVIALSNFSTSHTRFRDLLTRYCGTRYASMPLFEEDMFYGPMRVDWERLARRSNALAEVLNRGRAVFVTAPKGTELEMSIEGRKVYADTGVLTKPGAFGNVPAGEVCLAPVEGSTNGRLVLEWAPTHKLGSTVTLEIEKGMVKGVRGEDPYARWLEDTLNKNQDFRNIAELGIGTNDRARRPDNILESEKILGTIHIALGDNSSFGGNVRTPFHQDYVVFKPTVDVRDGGVRRVLEGGRLIYSCELLEARG
ncbi:MAG: aminopeptidase [Deltaproteobacteria bacterium]|nr:aminopeptidase [Deltaproteobacteria bacterium]